MIFGSQMVLAACEYIFKKKKKGGKTAFSECFVADKLIVNDLQEIAQQLVLSL